MDNLFDGFFDDMQSVYLYNYSFKNFLKLNLEGKLIKTKKTKKINQMTGRMKIV